jgi:hypothetical protein
MRKSYRRRGQLQQQSIAPSRQAIFRATTFTLESRHDVKNCILTQRRRELTSSCAVSTACRLHFAQRSSRTEDLRAQRLTDQVSQLFSTRQPWRLRRLVDRRRGIANHRRRHHELPTESVCQAGKLACTKQATIGGSSNGQFPLFFRAIAVPLRTSRPFATLRETTAHAAARSRAACSRISRTSSAPLRYAPSPAGRRS